MQALRLGDRRSGGEPQRARRHELTGRRSYVSPLFSHAGFRSAALSARAARTSPVSFDNRETAQANSSASYYHRGRTQIAGVGGSVRRKRRAQGETLVGRATQSQTASRRTCRSPSQATNDSLSPHFERRSKACQSMDTTSNQRKELRLRGIRSEVP